MLGRVMERQGLLSAELHRRALATLAYTRYRGDFFRDELLTALQILEPAVRYQRGIIDLVSGRLLLSAISTSDAKVDKIDIGVSGVTVETLNPEVLPINLRASPKWPCGAGALDPADLMLLWNTYQRAT